MLISVLYLIPFGSRNYRLIISSHLLVKRPKDTNNTHVSVRWKISFGWRTFFSQRNKGTRPTLITLVGGHFSCMFDWIYVYYVWYVFLLEFRKSSLRHFPKVFKYYSFLTSPTFNMVTIHFVDYSTCNILNLCKELVSCFPSLFRLVSTVYILSIKYLCYT